MTVSTEAAGPGDARTPGDGSSVAVAPRVPDFFVVGHPKCGTTALYEMLRSHPRIFMPDLKEPWYFAEDLRPRFQPARTGEVPDTLESYLALFAEADETQLTGEASSSYLRSHVAAAGIARLRPDARAIAIVREPAGFLHSLHQQMLHDHIETERDLAGALALEDERRRGRRIPRRSHLPQMLLYSDYVRYAEQLRRYTEALGAERILVVIYDDFRNDNHTTLERVQRFLGVDPEPLELIEANRSDSTMRSQRLDDLLTGVAVGRNPVARAVKAAVKAVVPTTARRQAMRHTRRRVVLAPPSRPDDALMRELRERYRGEVEELGAMLGRDLTALWGYDR